MALGLGVDTASVILVTIDLDAALGLAFAFLRPKIRLKLDAQPFPGLGSFVGNIPILAIFVFCGMSLSFFASSIAWLNSFCKPKSFSLYFSVSFAATSFAFAIDPRRNA